MRIAASVILVVVMLPAGMGLADGKPIRSQQLKLDSDSGEFLEIPPPQPGTAEGDLRLIQASLAAGDLRQADGQVDDWLEEYGETHVLAPEALVLRAAVEISRGDYYKAHRHLESFLDLYESSQAAQRALELEFIVAERFLSGTKRKVWGVRMLDATEKGLEILDTIANDYPGSALAEKAIKTKADFFFRTGDFTMAEMEFARLGDEFPRSRYARLSERKSAESALASFHGIEFDDAALIEAEDRFLQYLASYPGVAEQEGVGQILQQIRSQRAAKEFSIGEYYERTNHLDSALFYYQSTRMHWPDTVAAANAQARISALGGSTNSDSSSEAALTEMESTP